MFRRKVKTFYGNLQYFCLFFFEKSYILLSESGRAEFLDKSYKSYKSYKITSRVNLIGFIRSIRLIIYMRFLGCLLCLFGREYAVTAQQGIYSRLLSAETSVELGRVFGASALKYVVAE